MLDLYDAGSPIIERDHRAMEADRRRVGVQQSVLAHGERRLLTFDDTDFRLHGRRTEMVTP